jgi:hypothetical protein
MKRLANGLAKPCSSARRVPLGDDILVSRCSRAPYPSPGPQQQTRHASSRGSRPRTALFFPGIYLSFCARVIILRTFADELGRPRGPKSWYAQPMARSVPSNRWPLN